MKIQRLLLSFFILLFAGLLFQSCNIEKKPEPVYIGISKALPEEYYGNYAKWLNTADSSVVCIDLYHMPIDSALYKLGMCSGLLLSGGPDVYPGRYGQEADTSKCGEFDLFRDSLEWALITKAKEMKIPILGICRGLQIFNVYHGGTLYADIPTEFISNTTITHRCENIYDCNHEIKLYRKLSLFQITQTGNGMVNSYHHQGIRKLGDGIRQNARSNDGLIEAIQYRDAKNKPFFLGVQWHPERMDIQSPYSLPIAIYFLQQAKLFHLNKINANETR